MVASVFELFKIGVGPSSSHTMGPMLAAATFVEELVCDFDTIQITLYGSLALTGKGHATDRAIILGLAGNRPNTLIPDEADEHITQIRSSGIIAIKTAHNEQQHISFDEGRDLIFNQRKRLDYHSNGMIFTAYKDDMKVSEKTYYSVGGGAIIGEEAIGQNAPIDEGLWDIPYNFKSGAALLQISQDTNLSIADIMRENERILRDDEQIAKKLQSIIEVMENCIDRGIAQGGILPGGLKVKRRAPEIFKQLMERQERSLSDPLTVLDWLNLWALAVNEENAAGGKVVTAPTNGAAGIIPSVLRFYDRFTPNSDWQGKEIFLLTAAAIGSLFKENASISGAEVGCQGEVGVACSMAAAGLTAAWGGSSLQIENAAEIGMEHNLGLTCDPVAGLVQVPCIERNAVGAVKAIEAARLAIMGDGTHRVSLDEVIETMRKTGLDMSERYKETSQGGLAVNLVEC